MFGVRPVSHDFLHDLDAIRADGFDPFQDAAGGPLQISLMGFGPMFLQRGGAARPIATEVGHHAFAVRKQLHRFVGQP